MRSRSFLLIPAALLTMCLTACGPDDIDVAKAISRSLPSMPKFCRPLTDAQIRATLTALKGKDAREVSYALGQEWLASNREKAACVIWYERQRARYAKG